MSATPLTRTRILEGVWEGVLTHPGTNGAAPALVATHLGEEIGGLEVLPAGPGEWTLRLPIPADPRVVRQVRWIGSTGWGMDDVRARGVPSGG